MGSQGCPLAICASFELHLPSRERETCLVSNLFPTRIPEHQTSTASNPPPPQQAGRFHLCKGCFFLLVLKKTRMLKNQPFSLRFSRKKDPWKWKWKVTRGKWSKYKRVEVRVLGREIWGSPSPRPSPVPGDAGLVHELCVSLVRVADPIPRMGLKRIRQEQ